MAAPGRTARKATSSPEDALHAWDETKATVATVSWTNNVGETVTVQVEGKTTLASSGTGFAYPTYSGIEGGGGGRIEVDASTFPGGSRGYAWTKQLSVPAGNTVTSKIELTAQSGGGAGQSASWAYAWVRISVIKR